MLTRDQAIEIARRCAKAKPQSYYAEPFQPHEWVIDAIVDASRNDPQVRPCPTCGVDAGEPCFYVPGAPRYWLAPVHPSVQVHPARVSGKEG